MIGAVPLVTMAQSAANVMHSHAWGSHRSKCNDDDFNSFRGIACEGFFDASRTPTTNPRTQPRPHNLPPALASQPAPSLTPKITIAQANGLGTLGPTLGGVFWCGFLHDQSLDPLSLKAKRPPGR